MKKNRSHCPINFALEVFGDKWTLLILRDLILFRKKTYGELKIMSEGIATNVLADRLQLLEVEGIVAKAQDPQNAKVYYYSVTRKGLDLIPILLEMAVWSAKYDEQTVAPKRIISNIKRDRTKVVQQILDALKDPNKALFKDAA